MSAQYSATKPKDYRRVRPEIVLSTILLVIVIGVLAFIVFDSNRQKTVIDNSENDAVLGQYVIDEDPYVQVDGGFFTMEIPSDWVDVKTERSGNENG